MEFHPVTFDNPGNNPDDPKTRVPDNPVQLPDNPDDPKTAVPDDPVQLPDNPDDPKTAVPVLFDDPKK